MHRDDIIHAAAQIFRQKGYDATSMQDIADAVGLQEGVALPPRLKANKRSCWSSSTTRST